MDEPSMVERVARAIYEADEPWSEAFPWPALPPMHSGPDQYRRIARAAIEAMREPTDRMIDAGVDARRALYDRMEAAGKDTKTVLVANHPAGTIYAAMIDAALAKN